MNKKIFDNKGIALILALSVITILMASTLQLNRELRVEIEASSQRKDHLVLNEIAMSGIELAVFLLTTDKNNPKTTNIDTVQEEWADQYSIWEKINCLKFSSGKLKSLIITDEMSKIKLNALIDAPYGKSLIPSQTVLWENFLKLYLSEDDEKKFDIEIKGIIAATKDWLDASDGEIAEEKGAERSYYDGKQISSFGINSPLVHINDFKRVKNIDKLSEIIGEEVLDKSFTIYGSYKVGDATRYDGRININTADLNVLKALMPPQQQNTGCAEAMIEYRSKREGKNFVNKLENPIWYKECKECKEVNLNTSLIVGNSNYFRVLANAELNGKELNLMAILHRIKDPKKNKWVTQVLYVSEK